MPKIKVLRYPDKKLTTPSVPVGSITEARKILDKLDLAITQQMWGRVLGFAAPQIGINKRVFIAERRVYINPEIYWRSDGFDYCREGCYSLEPGRYDYEVKRSQSIRIRWTDEHGTEHDEKFNGRRAQIIQHEYDHIEGILCCGKD